MLTASDNLVPTHRVRRVMTKLSRQPRIIPGFLFLQGTQPSDAEYQAHGGFADVYQARYHGELVALKRINRSSHVTDNEIAKVCHIESITLIHLTGSDVVTLRWRLKFSFGAIFSTRMFSLSWVLIRPHSMGISALSLLGCKMETLDLVQKP